MRVEGFTARADIVGRRVVVAWDVVLDAGESLAAAPNIVLRRKQRDFEFPPPAPGDPFGVYDSTAFPPPGTAVTEIDLGSTVVNGLRAATVAESASRVVGGVAVEVLRRTRTTTFLPDGTARRRHEEILDVGGGGAGLQPRTTYYYQLAASAGLPTGPPPRATATPTDLFGSGRALYELLPSVYTRHDVTAGPAAHAVGAVPEANPANGQLRRFLDLFGAAADHLRGRADGLRDLHDVDDVDARMLPHLARWLGWDLSSDEPIPVQRHEIRYAAQLYRITGTLPGCTLWAKRLTGWDARVKEMWRNVLVTNDLGNPDDPNDHGSRTVDTSNAAAMAAIGTADDVLDYTYDTGTGPDDLYAFNVIAFYVMPAAGQTVHDVAVRRSRLLTATAAFLPANLRAVVVVEVPAATASSTTSLGLTASTDPGV